MSIQSLQRTGGLEFLSSWMVLTGRPPLNSVFGHRGRKGG